MVATADNNKRIAKNAIYMYLRMGITMLVSLYTSRIILQNLGVSDYGVYNIVGSVITAFSFLSTPLSTATQRFYNFELGKDNKQKLNVIFNMSFVIYLALSLILVIIIEIAGLWFINNKMSLPEGRLDAAIFAFHFYLVTFVISLMKIPFDSLIIAHERMSFYAWLSILEVVLQLLNAFSLAYLAVDKLELFSFNHFVISAILITISISYCLRSFKYIRFARIRKVWDKQIFKSLFSFSGWTMFGSVAIMASNQGIGIILNTFFGVIINAAMGIANQVGGAINQFASNFQIAFRPQIVKYYAAGQKNDFFILINRSSKMSYLLLFGLVCPVCFNIVFILNAWLGADYVPKYSAIFTILISVYNLIGVLSNPMSMAIQATGRIKKYQLINSSAIILYVIVSYIFLKLGFEPVVVLWLHCLLDIVYLVIRLLFLKSYVDYSIPIYMKQVLLPIILVTIVVISIMTAVSNAISNELSRFIVSICTFFIIYIPLVLFVGLNKSERNGMLMMIKNKVKHS